MEASQAIEVLKTDLHYGIVLKEDGLLGDTANEISRVMFEFVLCFCLFFSGGK